MFVVLFVTARLPVLPQPSQSRFARLLYFPPQSCFARQIWLRCPAFASGVAAPSQKTDRCPCSALAVSSEGRASAAQSRTRGSLSGMNFERKRKSYFSNPFLITSHACGGGAEHSEAEGEMQGSWRGVRRFLWTNPAVICYSKLTNCKGTHEGVASAGETAGAASQHTGPPKTGLACYGGRRPGASIARLMSSAWMCCVHGVCLPY